MEKQQLTEGQELVRMSFNPSQLERVKKAKQLMADAVDLLSQVDNEVKANKGNADNDYGKFAREVALAKTEIQKASWALVGACTHDITFKYSNKDMPTESKYQPHQQRVVDEQSELAIKCTNLEVFISTNDIFKTLNETEQTALVKQLDAMEIYNRILKERISRF